MEKSTLPNAAHLFWFLFASQFARVVAPIYHFTAATPTQADVTMMLCAAVVVVGKRGIMGKKWQEEGNKETGKKTLPALEWKIFQFHKCLKYHCVSAV